MKRRLAVHPVKSLALAGFLAGTVSTVQATPLSDRVTAPGRRAAAEYPQAGAMLLPVRGKTIGDKNVAAISPSHGHAGASSRDQAVGNRLAMSMRPRPPIRAVARIARARAAAALFSPEPRHHATERGASTAHLRTVTPPAHAWPTGSYHTVGGQIVDVVGHLVRITGINWFGLETCTFAPHGLWARNWQDILDQIVHLHYNTIRLPFSEQLLDPHSTPTGIDYTLNPDLYGLNGLQIMDRIVAGAGARGLKVILDQHRERCGNGTETALWYTRAYPQSIWLATWRFLAQRYAANPAVIGADLHNEPHGRASWGDGNPATDWRLAAQRGGNAILAIAPRWLIIVEGIERVGTDWYWWGGNLSNAGQYPVRLATSGRLVYEAHDYGPGIAPQAWFHDPRFPRNLPGIWRRHWAYLAATGSAPVFVGEFGGQSFGSDPEGL